MILVKFRNTLFVYYWKRGSIRASHVKRIQCELPVNVDYEQFKHQTAITVKKKKLTKHFSYIMDR